MPLCAALVFQRNAEPTRQFLHKRPCHAVEIDRLTGKRGPLLAVGDQWPAKNMTKSPGAVAPGKK
jgi:hypothetical protein